MQESEPPKKSKKRVQVQMSLDEELAKKLSEEDHARFNAKHEARFKVEQEQERIDFETTLELQKQLDEREEVASKSRQAYDIDWSDPGVIIYHTLQNRSFSIAEVRKNMYVMGSNQALCTKDLRLKKEVLKETRGQRQKKQDDPEKLMEYVEVISDSEEVISVTPLAVKSPIVGWKSYCKEDVGYYEIHRADGSYKTYIFFSQMLNDFDREDLIMLYRLFNEKYASTRPGFDDLMLWGDMKVMFEPNSDDVVWKNHNSQELIRWKLMILVVSLLLMLGELLRFISNASVDALLEKINTAKESQRFPEDKGEKSCEKIYSRRKMNYEALKLLQGVGFVVGGSFGTLLNKEVVT
ncbi:hypothetical protein Tco_0481925 [Tanacetum coccineum]